ncbi:MAG: flagellar M-ring protein FliF [Nitrospinae bacterium]|nr:flagellar M-ring protein FliF [Nitrospinota bacterium]
MAEFLKKFLEQLQETFKKIPPGRRVAILAAAGVIMTVLIVMVFWAKNEEFQLLYSNLSSEDASAIVTKLKEKRVPYKISAGGDSIMVPSKEVYELRLQLAGEGLPQGSGVGFEIFDKTSFGMTEFVQKLNYQRALQGELARTVNQFAEVEQSRVHIVMPEKVLFKEDQKKPTASVILKLKAGKRLKENQVQGIVHLVASAVEGLDASDITVVDMHGNILSGGRDASPSAKLTTSQMEYQQNLEKTLESRVQTMLEDVLGRNKAIVRVTTDMDFSQVERMEENYDPDSQVARSEQRTEESSHGAGLPSGIPGVQSNIPGAMPTMQTAGTPPRAQKTSETINYEINKVVRKIIEPVSKLKRLSVAVMVDGSYEDTKGEKGEEGRKYIPRNQEDMKKYEDIVKTAVGFNQERGDKVEVTNIPFEAIDIMAEKREMQAEARRQFWLSVIKYSLIGVVAALSFIFVIRPLLQWLTMLGAEMAPTEMLPKTVAELEAAMGEMPTPQKITKEEFRKRVHEFTSEHPDRAAELLRKWLRERK